MTNKHEAPTGSFEGYTPGPWYVSKHDSNLCNVWKDYSDERELIAITIDKWEEAEANAELIAAAPGLLAERDQLREALEAGYMIVHGKAHIRSNKDIPMSISDAKRERLIRNALRGVPHG